MVEILNIIFIIGLAYAGYKLGYAITDNIIAYLNKKKKGE